MTIAVHRSLDMLAMPGIAFALGAASAFFCRRAAGDSLGLFFGGVAFATLLAPPLVCSCDARFTSRRSLRLDDEAPLSQIQSALVILSITLGIALVWLLAIGDAITLRQWSACAVALLSYVLALGGLGTCLAALGANAIVSSALVTVLGLLWLTWPVWLSRVLATPTGETLIGWLVPAHPLFAINAVLVHFDSWDRYPVAYNRLTVLNQDVFYSMPAGVLWTTLAHTIMGGLLLAWAVKIERQRRLDPDGPLA